MGHQILGLEMAYNYSLKPTIKNVYECRQQVKLFYLKGITFKIYDIFQKLQLQILARHQEVRVPTWYTKHLGDNSTNLLKIVKEIE